MQYGVKCTYLFVTWNIYGVLSIQITVWHVYGVGPAHEIENGPRTPVAIALPLNILAPNSARPSTGQSLANRLTRDQKIVIHGNEF